MADRLVVFYDWQNVYEGAREAFFTDADPRPRGQIDPIALGHRIAARRVSRIPRVFGEARLYMGRPSNSRDPRTYAAHMRQCATLERNGAVVRHRTLRYRNGVPIQKGVDVQLAVDFIQGCIKREFEVGVMFSNDTDLVPALEAALEIHARGGPRPEVASWRGPAGSRNRLRVGGADLRCHWLDRDDYQSSEDARDYNIRQ